MRGPFVITLLAAYVWEAAITAGLYQAKLDSVHADLLHLQHNISALQSISKSNRHTEVEALCSRAKESLEKTRSTWKKITKAYGKRPWMASESIHKVSLEEHWYSCGRTLDTIYTHPHVLPESYPDYSQPVEACKETYQICQSSLKSIWSWQAPEPVPSGRYHQKDKEKRQERQKNHLIVSGPGDTGDKLRPCPAGQMACRISDHSTGYECIDVSRAKLAR
ncbi:hypothetical protein VP01_2300g6 [Puccinia sorghi]|uniref:Uncharacterized protein n=1 Tax=Puccinia sorghi TaxID=27349 RepID=A0A0L6V7V4_9BASI|nr:hypothetical protein VP01_2300g6 [Puccinia sorghi]